jgi:oligopeptide/dipeptide ABC transporter ATP-binding protein
VSFPTRRGPARAVDGVSFSLARGQVLGLVGESGSGKTVTALSILRLLDPRAQVAGRVRYLGEDLLTLPEREMCRRRGGKLAMIFQEPATSLNPVHRVGTQIAESIRLHRSLSRRSIRDEVHRLLSETQIPEPARRARQFPDELSGGMKQRVMIAMALAGKPDVLIADEPTTALDVTVQAEILRLLGRLRRDRGLAILLITHDLGVVSELADEVAVMYAGRIVEQGPATRLLTEPVHPYTQGLLRSLPRLDSTEPARAIDGVVPPPHAWPAGCRFRDRCPSATDRCAQDPPNVLLPGGRQASCWLAADP